MVMTHGAAHLNMFTDDNHGISVTHFRDGLEIEISDVTHPDHPVMLAAPMMSFDDAEALATGLLAAVRMGRITDKHIKAREEKANERR